MGGRALLMEFEPEIKETTLEKVLSFKEAVKENYDEVTLEIVTAYNSLLIIYPSTIENIYEEISHLKRLLQKAKIGKKMNSRLYELPVCYEKEFGLDLELISKEKNLSVEEIINLHSRQTYLVYFLGFLPGFLYLGGLDKRLRAPRKEQPRLEVKKGSVGIGENQTGIYPKTSPGGWQLIGNCPLPVFDKNSWPPCEISAGDQVKFYRVSKEEFLRIKGNVKTERLPEDITSLPGIEVLHPGLHSSIQDLGRKGALSFGVPVSGVMDVYAAKIANLSLRNTANAAVVEITLMGPKLKFHKETEIVLTGADLSPHLNSVAIENAMVYSIKPGDILSFQKRKSGCRAYLAVSGGFKTERVLNSRSWYEGVTSNNKLEKGVNLAIENLEKGQSNTHSMLRSSFDYLNSQEISVFKGPEFHLLSEEEQERLVGDFQVGKNYNRMAVQLEEDLENDLQSIITGPVLPGTVQLTPAGKLIVLMRDCQTTGGYPRVLQVSEKGMDILSQKVMGDKVKFILLDQI